MLQSKILILFLPLLCCVLAEPQNARFPTRRPLVRRQPWRRPTLPPVTTPAPAEKVTVVVTNPPVTTETPKPPQQDDSKLTIVYPENFHVKPAPSITLPLRPLRSRETRPAVRPTITTPTAATPTATTPTAATPTATTPTATTPTAATPTAATPTATTPTATTPTATTPTATTPTATTTSPTASPTDLLSKFLPRLVSYIASWSTAENSETETSSVPTVTANQPETTAVTTEAPKTSIAVITPAPTEPPATYPATTVATTEAPTTKITVVTPAVTQPPITYPIPTTVTTQGPTTTIQVTPAPTVPPTPEKDQVNPTSNSITNNGIIPNKPWYPTPTVIPTRPPVTSVTSVITQRPGTQLRDYVCKKSNGYYPVAKQCDGYIECKENVAIQYSCPDGLQFNPNAQWSEDPCEYPSDVKCISESVAHNAQPTAECPLRFGFFPPISGDCGTYLICEEGVAKIMHCPPGLGFNFDKNSCDWPINVPGCNPKALEGFTCPAPPVDEEGQHYIYKYSYGKSCRKYVACQQGHPRLLSCDAGYSFEEKTGLCVGSKFVGDCVA